MWTTSSLNPPPRDFTTAVALAELTRERMVSSVTYGRPNTAMMSFAKRLSAQEIEAVVDYVRTTFVGKAVREAQAPAAGHGHSMAQANAAVPLPDADMSLPFPNGLQGRLEPGRDFFLHNCFTCHGKNGDGKGPRADFIRPPPRNFHTAESRRLLNRPALFKAIGIGKPGTVMPAWRTVLSDQEIADVAEFVFQTFITQEAPPATVSSRDQGGEKKKVTQ